MINIALNPGRRGPSISIDCGEKHFHFVCNCCEMEVERTRNIEIQYAQKCTLMRFIFLIIGIAKCPHLRNSTKTHKIISNMKYTKISKSPVGQEVLRNNTCVQLMDISGNMSCTRDILVFSSSDFKKFRPRPHVYVYVRKRIFFVRLDLPSTRKRRKRSLKTDIFETSARVDKFVNA